MHRLLTIFALAVAVTVAVAFSVGCKEVSKAQCERVKPGMDITQVAKILGSRGAEKPTGSTAGVNVTHRTWTNSDGSACDVMFRKGKVYKKMWSN